MPDESTPNILHDADELVGGDRQTDYGPPGELHANIGKIWGVILGVPAISAEDVALCMIAVKLARQAARPKRDNIVDMAGYARVLELIQQERSDVAGKHPAEGSFGPLGQVP